MSIKECGSCGTKLDLENKKIKYNTVRLEFFDKKNGTAHMRRIYFCNQQCLMNKIGNK